MGFTDPIGWIFASLALVLLYLFLRPQRQPARIVPAVFLWPQLPPPRRRRWDPLLLLQLLALLALVAALAGPYVERPAPSLPQRHVLVLDRTASMQARYGAGTRFEAAKAEADRYVSSLKPGDQVALVSVAEQAELLVPFSNDLEGVRRSLAALKPYDSGGRLAQALSLAHSLVQAAEPRGQVAVFSDFADADLPAALLAHAQLFPVGVGDDNVGIESLEITQPRWQTGARPELALRVRNFGSTAKHGLLLLEREGQPLLQKGFTLEAGQTETVVQPLVGAGVVSARLLVPDLLAADNEASVYVPETDSLRVCLVSPQLDRWPELQLLSAAARNLRFDTRGCATGGGEADVYLFHRVRPPEDFPHPALVVDPPARVAGQSGRSFREVKLVAWDARHPIFAGWTPAFPMPLTRVRAIEVSGNAVPLLWGKAGDELVTVAWIKEAPGRQVWWAFDPVREPLLTSEGFPLAVFLLQSLAWLKPAEPAASVWPVGQAWPLAVGSPAVVRLPNGEEHPLPSGTESFVPHWRGHYEFHGPKGTASVHVAAADPREGDIAPKLRAASAPSSGPSMLAATERVPWGKAVLTAALVLLLFEAWIASRLASGVTR